MMKALRSLTALIVLLPVAPSIFAGITSWHFHHEPYASRYTTHGQDARGHEFGFIKNPGDCSQDNLYISWLMYHPDIRKRVGQNVTIYFDVDGVRFQKTVPLMVSSESISGGMTRLIFTNVRASTHLLRLLEEGDSLELSFALPGGQGNMLDATIDRFDLKGLRDARENARNLCAASRESVTAVPIWQGILLFLGGG